ncbi:MAG: PAS domain S-box protein [Phycisphaerales bacterium]|nr:PAS domain S-box protein [Phycisphaerales bacterium]
MINAKPGGGHPHDAASLLTDLPAPCALLDAEGKVEAVNEAWRANAGSDSIHVSVGQSLIEMLATHTRSARITEGLSAVLSGRAETFIFDLATAGASGRRWFRVLAARRSRGAAVLLVDITDRHETEQALRESESRFRQMVESLQDYAVHTLDAAGLIQTWNAGAERLTGYTAEEVIGRPWSGFYTEEDRAAGKPEQHLRAAESVSRIEFELWRLRRDGSRFWAGVTMTCLRDEAGRPRGFSTATRDLTESRRSEGALRESQTRLSQIIDSAMDAIITVDETQHIVMFNHAAERIFGVTATEAIGGPLDRLIPNRFRRAHGEHIRSFGRTGVTTRGMGRLQTLSGLRADGKEFPIEASISQAVAGGQRFFTVILRDVSERRALEEQLLQSQKMEGIGRLAGGVAHDFNNLLMAIFNYVALASNKVEPSHPAQAYLAQVHEAAERAATLTRQLLAFARKQVVSPRVLCPSEVVSGLEPLLRRLLGENLLLRTAIDDITGNVRADRTQLEQVIMNLAVNARDAMPRGGTLTIETGNVTLDDEYCRTRVGASPGEHVMLAVTDTGEGMSPDVLNRLFEPFFTTKPPGKGTGLGLATCHGIVKQSGGHIAVYSEPGRGTSVKVFLPRVTEAGAAAEASPVPSAPIGGTETILLAEDSEMVRALTLEALRNAGYTVISGANGPDALRAVGDRTIDLLITDVVMPEMSGVELAATLARQRPGLRVIYISGYTEETVVHHGVEDRAGAFLAKPFMTTMLLRKVREVLDGPGPDIS